MMVAGTYVLTDTINQSFDEIFTESNEGTDAVVIAKEIVETDDGTEPPIPASLLPRDRRRPGVASAAGGITDPQVSIIGKDGERLGGGGPPTFGISIIPEPLRPAHHRRAQAAHRRRGRDRQVLGRERGL